MRARPKTKSLYHSPASLETMDPWNQSSGEGQWILKMFLLTESKRVTLRPSVILVRVDLVQTINSE